MISYTKKLLICGVLFIALCIGLIPLLGLPNSVSLAIEGVIYLLLLVSLISRNSRGLPWPSMWGGLFSMLMVAACSIALNEIEIHRSIFSLRLLYRFYIFYLAITFLELSDEDFKIINLFIAFLFLIQIPVVAIKFLLRGIRETTTGLYSTGDGSLTTYIPIVVIFYAASYYLLYRKKVSYVITIFGFVFVAIAGAKRAVFYLFPIQFMAIYYFIYFKNKSIPFTKKIGGFVAIFAIILVMSSLILSLNRSFNPEGEVGGSIDPGYALRYTERYNMGVDGYGNTYGRLSTTIRTIELLWDSGPLQLLFGSGPGLKTRTFLDDKADKKRFKELKEEEMISYGQTAMTKIAAEYGILGVFSYLLILIPAAVMCLKYVRYENDPYWKAFAAGSVGFSFSMLIFFFIYNASSIWGDTLPALYFYAMAVVYTRLYRIISRSEEKNLLKIKNSSLVHSTNNY